MGKREEVDDASISDEDERAIAEIVVTVPAHPATKTCLGWNCHRDKTTQAVQITKKGMLTTRTMQLSRLSSEEFVPSLQRLIESMEGLRIPGKALTEKVDFVN